MGFIRAHALWFWGLGGVVLLYFIYNLFSSQSDGAGQPTAADIASQGTLAPGAGVYASTGGGIYADPNAAGNTALLNSILNSGASSTAPSSIAPVAGASNSGALGLLTGLGTAAFGAYSGGGSNTNPASASAITMPDLSSLLPPIIPSNQPNATLSAPTAPMAQQSSASSASTSSASSASTPNQASASQSVPSQLVAQLQASVGSTGYGAGSQLMGAN